MYTLISSQPVLFKLTKGKSPAYQTFTAKQQLFIFSKLTAHLYSCQVTLDQTYV